MTMLVIPAAGQSTRYGLSRPKFLLQHPSEGTMLSAAISGFGNLANAGITSIRVISLASFFEEISVLKLVKELTEKFGIPVEFDLLDRPTGSMVETLTVSLSKLKQDESIVIKDCDNLVSFGKFPFPRGANFVSYADLTKFPNVVAHNKSYLTFGVNEELDGIVEKKIVGSFINVGCIGINSVSDFLAAAMSIKLTREVYVSDVIRVMLDQKISFRGVEVDQYEDWGTLEEWQRYTDSFGTLFVDLDGVTLNNENPLGAKYDWSSVRPIQPNIKYLQEISNSGRVILIFTTARAEVYRAEVEQGLRESGFHGFQLIMGLLHAKRYLVNDFSPTNRYPTAIAINIPRNSENLSDYFPF